MESNKRAIPALLIIATILMVAFIPLKVEAQNIPDTRFPDIVRFNSPGTFADTVSVWGSVSRTGRFLVPRGTTIPELLTFAGGPGFGSTRDDGSVFRFYRRPQIEVYLNRIDPETFEEKVVRFTYRVSKPFPEEFRDFPVENIEYITIHTRTRPTVLDYITGVSSLVVSVLGTYLFFTRL